MIRPRVGIAIGAFGRAVNAALAGSQAVDFQLGVGATTRCAPAICDRAAVTIVASEVPSPTFFSVIDVRSRQLGATWLPITLEASAACIGPLVLRGRGACFSCGNRRRLQHAHRPEHRRLVMQSGVARGFLPIHARLLAQLATRLLAEAQPGSVLTLHPDTLQLRRGRVVGVHGCAACGTEADERSRSYRDLLACLPQEQPRAYGEEVRVAS